MAEWEVDIKVRRNGRLVERSLARGDRPETALYSAHNDLERWAQAHPENTPGPDTSEDGGS
ncbi:hypothetical protein ACFVAJ_17230 [Agromyces sp. NPDC057679]|uniref:hypothetical protein n=1 Tax=Agromyces sp. NPDC057679 TaxID=3346207 RepID=UPI00366D9727